MTPVLNLANLSYMEDVMEMATTSRQKLSVWRLVEVSNRCVTELVIIHLLLLFVSRMCAAKTLKP